MNTKYYFVAVLVIVGVLVAGCGLSEEELAAQTTTSAVATVAAMPTTTDTPTLTPRSTPTDIPTATLMPTETPTATPTLTSISTPTATPTAALSPTSTSTSTSTFTPTSTPTRFLTKTPRPPASATAPATITPLPAATAVGLVYIPNATIVYYDVSGSTENELRTQLDALGPVGYDGYKGDATAEWFIRWNWPGFGSSSCQLSEATVSYEIQVIFPRWTPPENVSSDLVAKWVSYTRALAEHEKGHVDYVVANYQSVLDAIRGAACETADAAAHAALAPIRQHDIDYDATTNHGATQGARFP